MVKGLGDRYSHYLSPTDNERQQEVESGLYAGIGVVLELRAGKVVAAKILEGSPAARAGLQAGDEILAADGRDLPSLKSIDKVANVLRGRKGSTVALSVRRNGQQFDVSVTREEIHRPVVEFRLLEDGIGYLRLADFPNNVHRDIESGLRSLQGRGMRGLVLDLHENSGGFLDEAVRIADLFIAEGAIVSTRGRHPRDERTWRASPGGMAEPLPLIVLVDGGTASAGEILAGTLRDHGRARLVGVRTFGKGAVNRRFPLPDGSGLLLTTGRYYLPNGEAIEGKGLTPDADVPSLTRDEIKKLPEGTTPPDRQLLEATRLLAQQLGLAKP
jgi:carboxyl-terminal processing protease